MKIKITDLLDTYYDNSMNHSPTKAATTPLSMPQKGKHTLKKPLTAAACLILLLCGTVMVGLRFMGSDMGGSLSQPEAPEIPIMDASFMDESLTEPEEIQDSPEYNPEVNTHTVYTSQLNIPIDGLSLGFESDGKDYLSLLTIDPVNQTFRWSAHLPGLEALRWETYPEDGRNSFDDENYTEAFFSWVNYLDENICRNAVLRFADGSELTLYGGESFGFDSNLLTMEGTLDVLEVEQAVTVTDYTPVELILEDISYAFISEESREAVLDLSGNTTEEKLLIHATEQTYHAELSLYDSDDETCTPITHLTTGQNVTATLTMNWPETEDNKTYTLNYRLLDRNMEELASFTSQHTAPGDWAETLDTAELPGLTDAPGCYTLEIYLDDSLLIGNQFYVTDPGTQYAPAQDTDGDGYLTSWLTYDTPDGTVVKLQLDVSANTFAWYIHNEALFDAYVAYEAGTGDWDTFDTLHVEVINDLLENYFKTAYIVFTDGTKVPVGGGDAFRLEDDLIREESIVALTSTTQDYYPAYLEFDGVRYDFE